jgi:hypothetical protein|tara:strand:+ start:30102 stop:30800 length:699 start_codon:yes stop_codon:yes gene_type:complete
VVTAPARRVVVEVARRKTYLKLMPAKKAIVPALTKEWTLPPAATLGSSVRTKGILLEVRAQLPSALKKAVDVRGAELILSMPKTAADDFKAVSAVVSKTLVGIENLPVIPREIQDILTISPTERHRWLTDGRLQSAGTRTVKLRGRAKKITFHVFDPRHVEDVLDRDLIAVWREDDAETAAENRRRAAGKRALARVEKTRSKAAPVADDGPEDAGRHKLKGWAEFERDGLLR